jgi:hypothetical protein
VKDLILESVDTWKNFKKWVLRIGQNTSGSVSLPYQTVVLTTEDQTLERKQKERDVLEALGEY